jgi:hypothetical protein
LVSSIDEIDVRRSGQEVELSVGDYYASTAALLPVVVLTKTASHAVTASYQSPQAYKATKARGQWHWGDLHRLAFLTAAGGEGLALFGAFNDSQNRVVAWGTALLVAVTVVLLIAGAFHEEEVRRKRPG